MTTQKRNSLRHFTVKNVLKVALSFSLGVTAQWSCDRVQQYHQQSLSVGTLEDSLDGILALESVLDEVGGLVEAIDHYSAHTDSLLKEPITVQYPPYPRAFRETTLVSVPVLTTKTIFDTIPVTFAQTVFDTIPYYVPREETTYVEFPSPPPAGWRIDIRRP